MGIRWKENRWKEKIGSFAMQKWMITLGIFAVSFLSFVAGVYATSHSYDYRYPTEYNWWVDHERLHHPGVLVSTALVNTSCHQTGNVLPPVGNNITQIQWVGGWDAGFVGNMKIQYNGTVFIVPTPYYTGACIYVYDVSGDIIVYGQDISSGQWIKLGGRGGINR